MDDKILATFNAYSPEDVDAMAGCKQVLVDLETFAENLRGRWKHAEIGDERHAELTMIREQFLDLFGSHLY